MASVLRQAGVHVRMVVARPVESTSINFQNCTAPIVLTKILTDSEELDRQLFRNGCPDICSYDQANDDENDDVVLTPSIDVDVINVLNSINSSNVSISSINVLSDCEKRSPSVIPVEESTELTLPETKRFIVELSKNEYGLGLTIAGYVCEREDLCGIFVKSLSKGSEAYNCGEIQINDRIIEVDGQLLTNLTNYEAVDKLKQSGEKVKLTFERYLRGPKYEHLQEAIASQEVKDLSPPSPSVTTLSWIPIDTEVR